MKPSFAGLTELIAAHLTHIPFENISKIYYRKRFGLADLPSLAMYLDGVARYHFGGTCYSNNYHLYLLLSALGYEVKLCAADMSTPEVHAVNIVRVEGKEYLVDPGYAAPFLSPMPRDLTTDYVLVLGRDCYVLKPQDANGCSRLELYRDGILKHGYLAKPAPKKIEDFSRVIAESFGASATFLNSILCARFYPGRSVVIHNLSLIESCGSVSQIIRLRSLEELVSAIHEHLSIPRKIVSEAVNDLKQSQDAWGSPILSSRM